MYLCMCVFLTTQCQELKLAQPTQNYLSTHNKLLNMGKLAFTSKKIEQSCSPYIFLISTTKNPKLNITTYLLKKSLTSSRQTSEETEDLRNGTAIDFLGFLLASGILDLKLVTQIAPTDTNKSSFFLDRGTGD